MKDPVGPLGVDPYYSTVRSEEVSANLMRFIPRSFASKWFVMHSLCNAHLASLDDDTGSGKGTFDLLSITLQKP